MAQLTLYLPDNLERELRRAAKRAKKSVSAYVVELTGQKLKPGKWRKSFACSFGSWQGSFPTIEQLPYERRDEL